VCDPDEIDDTMDAMVDLDDEPDEYPTDDPLAAIGVTPGDLIHWCGNTDDDA